MFKSLQTIGCVILVGVLAMGCQNMDRGDQGLLIGGVAGGAAGHALTDHPAGTAAGAVGGAYLGKQIAEDN